MKHLRDGDVMDVVRQLSQTYVDELTLLAAIAALPDAREWLPMESAPMPGKFLVLLERPMTGSFIHAANWNANIKTIGGIFSFDAPKPMGWQEFPPLPDAPKEQT